MIIKVSVGASDHSQKLVSDRKLALSSDDKKRASNKSYILTFILKANDLSMLLLSPRLCFMPGSIVFEFDLSTHFSSRLLSAFVCSYRLLTSHLSPLTSHGFYRLKIILLQKSQKTAYKSSYCPTLTLKNYIKTN
ncbi:MAG: hypothetical protein ACQESP_08680, partial [Candidatus Muiribacteriota bacterium]